MITKIMIVILAIAISIRLIAQPIDMSSLKDLPRDYDGHITIYSHGLAATDKQVIPYQKENIVYGPYVVTFNFPDSVHYNRTSVKTPKANSTIEEIEIPLGNAGDMEFANPSTLFDHTQIKKSLSNWYYKLVRGRYKYSSLAQDNDIEHLKAAYDAVTQQFPKAKIIFVGLSRGAGSIDTMRYKYNDMKQVVGVLTDSEFDTMHTVTQNKLNQMRLDRFISLDKALNIVEKLFSLYKKDGISPIKAIENVDISVPRLIVASKEDALVPVSCAMALYNKMRAMGHKKVHIWIADHGSHGKILEGPDKVKYQYVAHAFYKYYNLPHDPLLAKMGEFLFSKSQPNFSE